MIAEPPISDSTAPAASPDALGPPLPGPAGRGQGEGCLPASAFSPPSLSPSDLTLFYTYFELHENLAAVAEKSGRDYFDLLTWLNQPHIQTALEAHDQAVARADRRRALDALRESLETADNPTNLRRAATTLLRSTIVRTSAPPANRNGPNPPSPRGTRGEVSGGSATDGEGCTTVRTDALQPLASLPPLPPPTSRPTSSPDPNTAFAHIQAALLAPQLPLALSTLHAHATPTATFAGYPLPADPATWPDSLPATLPKDFALPLTLMEPPREVEHTDPPIQNPKSAIQNPQTSRWSLRVRGRANTSFDCALTLIRDPVNPDHEAEGSPRREGARRDDPCWRLASLDILRRTD